MEVHQAKMQVDGIDGATGIHRSSGCYRTTRYNEVLKV